VQKNKNNSLKQPKRKSRSSGSRSPRRIHIGTATILVIFTLIVAGAVGTYLLLRNNTESSSGSSQGSPTFFEQRKLLNGMLRETLQTFGIDPSQREVIESRDKMIDDQYSWYVLNWKILVDSPFDYAYAKNALERAVYESSGESDSMYNPDDATLPLKIEAYLNGRLSHRLFFTTREIQEKPVGRTKTSHSRLVDMQGPRSQLDSQLQRFLHDSGLQSLPMMIYEYTDVDNDPSFPIWIVNYEGSLDLFTVAESLRNSVSVPGFWFEENFEYRGTVSHVIDCYIDDTISHRIMFSSFPVGKGLKVTNSTDTNAVYISKPKVAIIIDDIGVNPEIANRIMDIGEPITLSILPHLTYSQEIALRAFKQNHEFMLHLPMEPGNAQINPGVGGIFVNQSSATKSQLTEENISAVPNISGINNHMGSKATSDAATMTAVLERIRESGLFFIDSRTAASTVAFDMARRMGIPTAERQVFLDTAAGPNYDFSVKQLRSLMAKVKRTGSCVAIGHPFPQTIKAIEDMVPEFKRQGIELVFASQVVTRFK